MKNLLLFIFAFITTLNVHSQCSPDTNFISPGIFPPGATVWDSIAIMPDAAAASPYSEIVQMVAPSDTIIDTLNLQIPATIDSIWLIDFVGLPASLSYVCNTSNCFMEGGDNACFTISGTPTVSEIGYHLIEIKAFGYVTVAGLGVLSDTISFYMSINVNSPVSINENTLSSSIKINPNPIKTVGYLSFDVPDAEDYTFEIIDLTGKKILSANGVSVRGQNKIQINRNDMAEGLYFYALYWNGLSHKGRLMFVD